MSIAYASRWIGGAALAALFVFGAHRHYARSVPLHPGDRLVPISLAALHGGDYRLQPAGPEIINIFATWCPPCREETPAFAKLAVRLRARGVRLIGIDQQESAAVVARFAAQFALPYPIFIDNANVTHDLLGARVIPTTIYVDRTGVIRWVHSGPLNATDLRSLARLDPSAG
ncbi:MAG: TlpA family protein disulfide reductase [Candidatus Baltobacteraceae bacterium]